MAASGIARNLLLIFCVIFPQASAFVLSASDVWDIFKTLHNRSYSEEEEMHRTSVFESNAQYILEHNLQADMGKHSYRLSLNLFADLTLDEFNSMNGLLPLQDQANVTYKQPAIPATDAPEELDWRKMGIVTPVKNQGTCGSCYAFATMAVLESQWMRVKGQLVDLSAQNIVDCSKPFGNRGCYGGFPTFTLQYVMHNQGVACDSYYPYERQENDCRYQTSYSCATCYDFVNLLDGDEQTLLHYLVYVGPITCGFMAKSQAFQFYTSGIFDSEELCRGRMITHAMAVVGYGVSENTPYWLIKNSYSKRWGEHGYVRAVRNKRNQCGVASLCTYAIVL